MRRLLLTLSALLLAWAALVLVTGGIQWRIAGVLLRSRNPGRALAAGLVLLLAQAWFFRASFLRDADRIAERLQPFLPALAMGCALMLAGQAVRYGAFTAGGSDSYGYLSQAYAWRHGTMTRPQPLPISLPWPAADRSLAPLGYSPAPPPHTMAPIYAPGLPLLMAAATVLGACGPFLVVPLLAGLTVWLTFLLGRRMAGPWAGFLAAIFAATSPVVVFQSMWPMSDIPVAALWTGAVLAALGDRRRSALAAGSWTAAALLVRPNLPLIPLVLFAHLVRSSRGSERWIRLALFCAPVAVAGTAIAVLYTAWHGAPWNSGFGSATEIFSLGNVAPNLTRYPVWLWQTESPLVLLALVPLLPRFAREVDQPAVRLCAVLFGATLLSYLVYALFEEWWYLRFLLPAIPSVFALMATGLLLLGRRLPRTVSAAAMTAVTFLLLAYTSHFIQERSIFGGLREAERRYAEVGTYIHHALPANAVIFSVQHSGSVRFYGGRLTIRWDLIDREWTGRAAAEVERLGLHPYMVIEDWETTQMRDWFGFAPEGPLPWPLVARLREPVGVSVLDLSSRPSGAMPVDVTVGGAPRCSALQPLSILRP